MGKEELDKKVMWHIIYSGLAELLKDIDGKELYKRCFKNKYRDKFIKLHNWAKKSENKKIKNKRTGGDFTVSSFDPVQFFASFNGFGMKEQSRINRINLYFKILGSDKRYEKIDFSGCPSPIMIALIANRNPETQEEVWSAFRDIMGKGINAQIDFEDTKKWYGISIGVFTILFFWINAKTFLPLDKNTVALLQRYGKIDKPPKEWDEYKKLLEKTKGLNISLAFIAWDEKLKEKLPDNEKYNINKFLEIDDISSIDKFGSFRLISIKLKEEFKTLEEKTYYLENKEVEQIDLYSIEKSVPINITAIVGKNGVGKSTLVELLLENMHGSKSNIVLTYEFNGEIKTIDFESVKDKNPFFNLLVNYSLYGLNESHSSSKWIKNIDENKIVIEPKRTNGTIDINELTKKLLSVLGKNLLRRELDNFSFRQLTSTSKAKKLISKKAQFEYKEFLFEGKEHKKDLYEYDIESLSEELTEYIDELTFLEDFIVDIELDNETFFNDLSSGEKQKIFTTNSIAYQIEKRNNLQELQYVNIILDEIELYFHPEYQRTYLNDLLQVLSQVDTSYIGGINIIFITHSPFILSDIPESKILFLDKDEENKISHTFGANIHTLLSGSFFMEDGLMGEFAKGKINEIKEFYEKVIEEKKTDENIEFYNKHQEKFWQIQKIIGEPFLQKVIKNYLDDLEILFSDDKTLIDKELTDIEKRKVYLESLKNAKN